MKAEGEGCLKPGALWGEPVKRLREEGNTCRFGTKVCKVQTDEISCENLISAQGSYFIPPDMVGRKVMVLPPDETVRADLSVFQKDHLTISESKVHNQGVIVTGDDDVEADQVVGIFDGTQIRWRFLSKHECKISQNKKTLDFRKYFVWQHSGEKGAECTRSLGYQVYNRNYYYHDQSGKNVFIGVDGIDSQSPVCNVNYSDELDNIYLVTCISPSVIANATNKKVLLHRPPEDYEVCFLAVAMRKIKVGEELLLNYGSVGNLDEGTFWGAEQYFFPFLDDSNTTVSFSSTGAYADIRCSSEKTNLLSRGYRRKLQRLIKRGLSLAEIAKQFNLRLENPFDHSKAWTAGCVQYLCEMLNVMAPAVTYQHVSFLYHCQSPEGKLDYAGRNYLAGFISNHIPWVKQPKVCFTTLAEAVCWLETVASTKTEDTSQQSAIELLRVELSDLKYMLNPDASVLFQGEVMEVDAPEKSELMDEVDSDDDDTDYLFDIKHIVKSYKKTSDDTVDRDGLRAICYQLRTKLPPPHTIWPERFRTSKWRNAHIRCLPELTPLGVIPATDYDVVTCYNIKSQKYKDALKKIIVAALSSGMSKEQVLKRVSRSGLRGKWMIGGNTERHFKPYLIPDMEGIPETLRGTSNWFELSDEHWELLGVDFKVRCQLSTKIEDYFKPDRDPLVSADSARVHICKSYASLWADNEGIKPEIKRVQPQLTALFNHLVHVSGAMLPTKAMDLWRPWDTLRVCVAGSEDYDDAMKMHLKKSFAKRETVLEIARHFNVGNRYINTQLSEEHWPLINVDIVESINPEKLTEWTGELVIREAERLEIEKPEDFEWLPGESVELQKIAQSWIDKTKKTTSSIRSAFRHNLERNPDLAVRFASHLKLDVEKVKKGCLSVMRVIISQLGVDLSKLKKELQGFCAVRKGELLNVMDVEHPDWSAAVVEIVKFYLEQGHSLSYVCYLLNHGSGSGKNAICLETVTMPTALKQGDKDSWDYNVMVGFLSQNDHTIESLVKSYPQLKECLELEKALFDKDGNLEELDGLIIDRMLGSAYPEEKRSHLRMCGKLPEYLKIKGRSRGTAATRTAQFQALCERVNKTDNT